jgi:DNA polymerase-3 subunit epsilon
MREVVLDTETTGLDPASGDRIVEIGCVELINHMPSGKTYHQYVNPQRDVPDGAFRVHGLSEAFLSEYPSFVEIAEQFFEFIGDAQLVIHNASFDMGFINNELDRISQDRLAMSRSIDTLQMARAKFPGAQASLDALCRRFEVDNSSREKHGALLDAELLSEVYLQLIGGRQPDFELARENRELVVKSDPGKIRPARAHAASKAELTANDSFVARLSNPIWKK